MSELFLISHNALPKKQFITRTEGNLWRLALHDDKIVSFFHFLKITEEFHCLLLRLLKNSFQIIITNLYYKLPLLSGMYHYMSQSSFASAHFHLTELCTAFWKDLLYQNYVLWQLESQNNFSQANNPILSHFHSLLSVILDYFLPLRSIYCLCRDFWVLLAPSYCVNCTKTSQKDNNWKRISTYWSSILWWVHRAQQPCTTQLLAPSPSKTGDRGRKWDEKAQGLR